MATKLSISQQEYEKLRKMGMTKEAIIAKYSADKPAPIVRAAETITKKLGYSATADVLGTNIARAANALNPSINAETRKVRADAIGKTNLKQNLGAAAQLGALAIPGGGQASLLKSTGLAALSGAASLGGQAAAENRDASRIASQAAIGGALGAGVNLAARGIQGLSRSLYKAPIPKNEQEARLLQTYRANKPFLERIKDAAMGQSTAPRTAADTAFDVARKAESRIPGVSAPKGLVGTESMLGVQARRAQSNLWNFIKPQLDSVADPVDMNTFFEQARKEIIDSTPELTRQKSLLNALESIVEDYADTPVVSYSKLQDLKKGWAEFVPQKAYKGEEISAALGEVRHTLASQARRMIYGRLGPEIRQAYIDHGNLEGLAALGRKAMTNAGLKGGTGGLTTTLLERTLIPITSVGGLTLYKAAQGVELLGRPGINTVGQFILDLTRQEDQSTSTPPTPQQPKTEMSSSPQPTTGGIKVKAPFGDGEVEITPAAAGLGTVKVVGKLAPKALPILKEALIKALEKAPRTPKLEYAEEAENLVQMMKTLRGKGLIDDANIRRVLEVLKLQGKNIQPFLDFIQKYTIK